MVGVCNLGRGAGCSPTGWYGGMRVGYQMKGAVITCDCGGRRRVWVRYSMTRVMVEYQMKGAVITLMVGVGEGCGFLIL